MAPQLLTLPEEILIAIMQQLDPTSLQCLRRVSRVFYESSQTDASATCTTIFLFEAQAYTKAFRYLLSLDQKQNVCLSCRKIQVENPRKAWDLVNEYLFCSACVVDHPTAFFSAAERRRCAGEKRTCIGYQGHIRLCQHETIAWEEIIWAKSWLMAEIKTRTTYDAANPPQVLLRECRHPSHRPAHHGFDACGFGADMESETAAAAVRPTAMLMKAGVRIVVHMKWTGHLQVPTPAAETRLSANDMAMHLRELRRGAAEYLVPQAGPGTLPEMRCFDSNHCSCLDFGDKHPPNALWSLMPCWGSADDNDKCCRVDPSQRLIPPPTRDIQDAKRATGDRKSAPATMTLLSCAFGSSNGWSVGVKQCHLEGQGRCLQFLYQRRIGCGGVNFPTWRRLDFSWFEGLDPDSYRIWEDWDTKGTLWCPDPSCANCYRYLERPIIRRCCGAAVDDLYQSTHDTTPYFRIKGVVISGTPAVFAEQERIARELAAPSTAVTCTSTSAASNTIPAAAGMPVVHRDGRALGKSAWGRYGQMLRSLFSM
ncbi:hypothetical protein QBC34DRAFT_364592 [Podospora aff. communis PSN243]|uniref:F-box domain-containing protein n=1 Tax=Podospora aff. communis PSN243 TaxID=3040156 RepID=A0AAV9FZE8_9PEZI|nr:hypothetical protein QBC34DRAFT_364592 [Podospora aff. communis PSN243]